MRNQPTYWLNMDSTGVTIHESGCVHVQKWARPPKWKEFPTEEAARSSTGRAIRECRDCIQVPDPGNGGPYHVVQEMAMRIQSALAEDPAQGWESVSERIKEEFAAKSRVLYNRALIDCPDGSDLLAQAVGGIEAQVRSGTALKMEVAIESALADGNSTSDEWTEVKAGIQRDNRLALGMLASVGASDPLAEAVRSQAPRIRSETVSKMRDALTDAVPIHSSRMELWNPIREIALSENRLAIGALREMGEISNNGAGLLDEALRQTDLKIVVRRDIDPSGRPVEYLAGSQAKLPENPECEKPPGKGNGGRSNFDILRLAAVLLSIAAAIATLIGVTVWDILPIPCDLPIFSLLPRC